MKTDAVMIRMMIPFWLMTTGCVLTQPAYPVDVRRDADAIVCSRSVGPNPQSVGQISYGGGIVTMELFRSSCNKAARQHGWEAFGWYPDGSPVPVELLQDGRVLRQTLDP